MSSKNVTYAASDSQQGILNGIDLNSIRLSSNFEESAGVQKLLLTVPVP